MNAWRGIVISFALAAPLLSGCHRGEIPLENRCAMYSDYYYNAGLGKSLAERRHATGVKFDDIRAILTADPSERTKTCRQILQDAFPDDPVLKSQGSAGNKRQ